MDTEMQKSINDMIERVNVARGLPDLNITGPCQLQSSPFCTNEGRQRLDPVDMLKAETSFAAYVQACQECYNTNADRYVAEVHAAPAPIAVNDRVHIIRSRERIETPMRVVMMVWKVLRIDGDRAQVDLAHGSLLGPQWENLSDLQRVP